jgi:hypothetical protein
MEFSFNNSLRFLQAIRHECVTFEEDEWPIATNCPDYVGRTLTLSQHEGESVVFRLLTSPPFFGIDNCPIQPCAVGLAVSLLSIQDRCLDPSAQSSCLDGTVSLFSVRKMRLRIVFLFSSKDSVDIIQRLEFISLDAAVCPRSPKFP